MTTREDTHDRDHSTAIAIPLLLCNSTLLTPHGTNLETTPDIVFHSNDGTVLAVTDSKYKNFGTRPKAADTYQVLTAGQVLGCQRVSLTYPVGEDKKPTMWRVPSALGGKDIELSALPLNLMSLAEPGGQTNLVATFTRWLEATIFEISDEEGT